MTVSDSQLSSVGDEWRRSVTMRPTGQPSGMTDLTSPQSHTRNKDITVTLCARRGVSHYRQLKCFFRQFVQANVKELRCCPSRITVLLWRGRWSIGGLSDRGDSNVEIVSMSWRHHYRGGGGGGWGWGWGGGGWGWGVGVGWGWGWGAAPCIPFSWRFSL